MGTRRAHCRRRPLRLGGWRDRPGGCPSRQQRLSATTCDSDDPGGTLQRGMQPPGRRRPIHQVRIHQIERQGTRAGHPPVSIGDSFAKALHLPRGPGVDRRGPAGGEAPHSFRARLRSGRDRGAAAGRPTRQDHSTPPARRRDAGHRPARVRTGLRRGRAGDRCGPRRRRLHPHHHRDVHGGGERGGRPDVRGSGSSAVAAYPPRTDVPRSRGASPVQPRRRLQPSGGTRSQGPQGASGRDERHAFSQSHPLLGAQDADQGGLLTGFGRTFRPRQRPLRPFHEPHPQVSRSHGASRDRCLPRPHRERNADPRRQGTKQARADPRRR